jgi:hypothetical protein
MSAAYREIRDTLQRELTMRDLQTAVFAVPINKVART